MSSSENNNKMYYDEMKLKHKHEELLSKMGYLGRIFGSGNDGTNNYLGIALIALTTVCVIAFFTGNTSKLELFTGLIGAIIGYMCKK